MLEKDFFSPKSIAVIGASSHPQKIGFSVLKNIIDGGYLGRVFPINPDAENIIGLPCYPSISNIRERIDMAVIVVPAHVVTKVLTECGKKRVKYVIIISAGFAEIGEEGKQKQQEIEKIAAVYGMRILGPNCLGLIDPVFKLNISFATNLPKEKDIAVISQSGATCTAILDWANEKAVGFSHFVSLGNKVDLNENDFLEYFAFDQSTKVILGYLESFSDGKELIEVSKNITKQKPFILLKAGRSTEGQKAASSHTGALASDDLVVSTALEEAGIIRAENVEDLFEWGMAFSNLKASRENNVLVITNAGGPAVLATDEIAKDKNLNFFQLNQNQFKKLKAKLPIGASLNNPIDLLGDATSERFEKVLETLRENEPDYKIILLTPQINTDIDNIAKKIAENYDQKTVVVLLGGKRFEEAKLILAKAHIPVFLYPERAVKAISVLAKYGKFKNKKNKPENYIKPFKKVASKILEKNELCDADIAKILNAYDIPMADSVLTSNVEEAVKASEHIGFPLVLKVTSPDILHKTEVGAVKLGIENENSLRESYSEVLENARTHFPEANILGVTVYKMVRSKIEVAIGAKRDPIFGPVIMFGLGGIYIELLKDFSLGLAPIPKEKAKEMIESIKSYELLNGYRKGEHFDTLAIAKAISGLSLLMNDFPKIKEIDVNPLRVQTKGEGVLALDAKIIFEKEEILVS